MQIDLLDSIDGIPAEDFDRLDTSAGAVGCYHRMRQLAADRRWQTRYLSCRVDGRLAALIPLYRPRGTSWPDAAYDPAGWPPPEIGDRAVADGAASECLLVGGRSDLLTALPIEEGLREPAAVRTILAAIAELAAEDGRGLAFPYLYAEPRQLIDEATDGCASWSLLGREGQLAGVSEPGWEQSQRRAVRYNLRHDRELIEAAGVRSVMLSWPELEVPASELIAEHNVRLGRFDHPEFVKLRNRQWHECESVEFLVFAASAGQATGYVTSWIWRDELAVYEIGLSGEQGADRLAVYLELVFGQPIRLARQRQLRTVRLGAAAERIKTGRGAVLHDLYGGVLNAIETSKLADG